MTYVIKCLRVLGSRVCDGKSAVTIQGEAQFWWRDLVRALPAAIYTTDARGRITFYNAAAAELWGSHPEIGKSEWCGSWKLYWPDGTPLPHDECPMAVALKTGRAVRGVEAVAERPREPAAQAMLRARPPGSSTPGRTSARSPGSRD